MKIFWRPRNFLDFLMETFGFQKLFGFTGASEEFFKEGFYKFLGFAYEIIYGFIWSFQLSLSFHFSLSALIRLVLKVCSGYTGATATLIFGGRAEIDPLKENCPDPKVYLVQTIDKLNRENPGQVKFFYL